jgi:CBS domain containing-hemolysin-like protein
MQFVAAALVIILAIMTTAAYAADAFAPAGTKATRRVDYVYESTGKNRSANLVAELAAQPATVMPTVQAIDNAQIAELQGKSDKAQLVAKQMAPMMAGVEEIMA